MARRIVERVRVSECNVQLSLLSIYMAIGEDGESGDPDKLARFLALLKSDRVSAERAFSVLAEFMAYNLDWVDDPKLDALTEKMREGPSSDGPYVAWLSIISRKAHKD